MIVAYQESPLKNKRIRIFLNDGRHYDFGLKGGMTYIEHRNEKIRENYWKRHLGNKTEKKLIENLIPSPALFSAYILWGKYFNIDENIKMLNLLWKKQNKL
jgi:hypothetical protein